MRASARARKVEAIPGGLAGLRPAINSALPQRVADLFRSAFRTLSVLRVYKKGTTSPARMPVQMVFSPGHCLAPSSFGPERHAQVNCSPPAYIGGLRCMLLRRLGKLVIALTTLFSPAS